MALHVASVAPVQRSTEGRDRRPTLDSDVRVAIEGDSLGRIEVGHHINQGVGAGAVPAALTTI